MRDPTPPALSCLPGAPTPQPSTSRRNGEPKANRGHNDHFVERRTVPGHGRHRTPRRQTVGLRLRFPYLTTRTSAIRAPSALLRFMASRVPIRTQAVGQRQPPGVSIRPTPGRQSVKLPAAVTAERTSGPHRLRGAALQNRSARTHQSSAGVVTRSDGLEPRKNMASSSSPVLAAVAAVGAVYRTVTAPPAF